MRPYLTGTGSSDDDESEDGGEYTCALCEAEFDEPALENACPKCGYGYAIGPSGGPEKSVEGE